MWRTMKSNVFPQFWPAFTIACMRLHLLLPLFLASFVAHAQPWAIAIHGGAGEAEWEHMDSATASAYHASLARALVAGSAVLARHGSALDAVEASVEVLEDDPLFNAGRGSAWIRIWDMSGCPAQYLSSVAMRNI